MKQINDEYRRRVIEIISAVQTHEFSHSEATEELTALIDKARIDEVDRLGRKHERVMYLKDKGIGTAVPTSLFYDRVEELKSNIDGK